MFKLFRVNPTRNQVLLPGIRYAILHCTIAERGPGRSCHRHPLISLIEVIILCHHSDMRQRHRPGKAARAAAATACCICTTTMTRNEVIISKQNFLLVPVSSQYPLSTTLRRHLFLNSWNSRTAEELPTPCLTSPLQPHMLPCRQGPRKTSVITTAAIGSGAQLEHPARARNSHVIIQQPCACRASARGLQQQLC